MRYRWPMGTTNEYVMRFQSVADELAAKGAGQTRIVSALIEVIVQLAYEDRQWAPDMLEGVAGCSRRPSRPPAPSKISMI